MSTSQCINDVKNTVYMNKEKGLQVVGACVDIEKAYDRTRIVILIIKMRDLSFNLSDTT